MLDSRAALTSVTVTSTTMLRPPSVEQSLAIGQGGAARQSGSLLTVAVLSAGVHEPSTTAALASDLVAAVAAAAEPLGLRIDTRIVEVRDFAGDLAAASIGHAPSETLREMIAAVTTADALIAVTPVFAASYAGLFKSFFDVLDPDCLTGMPTVIGATGGSVRHSLVIDHALRPLLAYFRAAVVPTGVFATPEDVPGTAQSARLVERIERAGRELAAVLAARPAMVSPAIDRNPA
ncbi:MAG: CE1759 family FMN reductase [Nakamurella sp.]